MIQDIGPLEFSNAYETAPGGPRDYVLSFEGHDFAAHRSDDGLIDALPTLGCFGDSFSRTHDAVFLFRIGGERYCLALPRNPQPDVPAPACDAPGYGYVSMRDFGAIAPRHLRMAVSTGIQLNRWYRAGRFCGVCGGEMRRSEAERMLECPTCGNQVYPRIQPAVIVAVTDGDRLLMTRYAGRGYVHRALVAGFCEIGETAEETVAREVMEETGIRVKNIRYRGSQPWGLASDLLLGFTAELDGDPTIHIDPGELASAEWVRREDIFEEDDGVSLTRHLVMRFKNGELV